MTTWGFLGSGHIGTTVARLAVDAGHDVVMSNSRGPATLADLVAELGPHARAADARTAAAAGDVAVVTIPLRAYRDVPVAELEDESTTTSELLAAHLPGSRVVKVFNNIAFVHLAALARPSGSPDRTTLPIAGDDVEAKATATALLDAIGYDALDVGPLAEGWRFQRDTAAYGSIYATDPTAWFSSPARRVTREELAAALARARRYRDPA